MVDPTENLHQLSVQLNYDFRQDHYLADKHPLLILGMLVPMQKELWAWEYRLIKYGMTYHLFVQGLIGGAGGGISVQAKG